MLAREASGAIRYHRARHAALRFREELAEVPFGIATMTDRVLPHLFPSVNEDAFLRRWRDRSASTGRRRRATSSRRRPGWSRSSRSRSAATSRRPRGTGLLVVLTDGESVPVSGARLAAASAGLRASIPSSCTCGRATSACMRGARSSPSTAPTRAPARSSRAVAGAVGGEVYGENDLDDAIAKARELVGEGELRAARARSRTRSRSRRISRARSSSRSRCCSGAATASRRVWPAERRRTGR